MIVDTQKLFKIRFTISLLGVLKISGEKASLEVKASTLESLKQSPPNSQYCPESYRNPENFVNIMQETGYCLPLYYSF